MNPFTGDRELLFTLLLKMGAAAAIAAVVVRSATFRKVLYTEIRDTDLKLKLMLFLTPPLAFGVLMRFAGGPANPYRFADLMLEGSFILGLLGGRVVGPSAARSSACPHF